MSVCERITPSGPMLSRSWPGPLPFAGSPSTQKSCTRVPAPIRTLGNERKSGLLKVHCLGQALEDANHLQPFPSIGQGWTPFLDAVGELAELDVERLGNVDVPQPHVTGSHDQPVLGVGFEGPEVGIDVLDVNPFVKDLDGRIPG